MPFDPAMTEAQTLSFEIWRSAVDHRLLEIYCIDIEDAGFDDQYLLKNWQSNSKPIEFVDWFGAKHDLTARSDFRLSVLRA